MSNILIDSLKRKEAELEVQLEAIRSMIADEIRRSGTGSEKYQVPIEFTPGTHNDSKINKPFKGKSYGNTVPEKFLGVLKHNQRFMKVREIATEISSVEGGDIEEWVLRLSRCTKQLRERNKIIQHQVGKSRLNFFWGSPNWVENGEITEGHEYDPSSIEAGGSVIDDILL